MKRGKRSFNERAQARMLDLWAPGSGFGEPVGCVATTFTFDAGFFEEECLARFARIESSPAEDARQYLLEREEKLSQAFACLLVDQANVPTQRSLRWHVLAARVPGGILHSKLSLLVWERGIRIIVSSANITEPGYRRNYENACVLEFVPDDGAPLELVEETLAFIDRIRTFAPAPGATNGAQAGLRSFLGGVRRQISPWARTKWRAGGERAVLAPIEPGGASLFEQLASMTNERYDCAWIQTPFFDEGAGCLGVLTGLDDVMAKRGERQLTFVVPGRQRPNGVFELEAPECLQESRRRVTHYFSYVDERATDEEGNATGEIRPLHAKTLWLQNDNAVLYCVGSSNFTHAGTGMAKPGRGNIELNVAYVFPDRDSELAKICRLTSPPYNELDLDEDEVAFLPSERDRTSDGVESPPLPIAFGEAVFHPGPVPLLALEIEGDPPSHFEVVHESKGVLLSRTAWTNSGRPRLTQIGWDQSRPPSHLEVQWTDNEKNTHRSIWTINVADTSLLPPPEELGQLTLEELLEVLTSAQKPYQVVGKILRRRDEAAKRSGAGHLDPHRRVEAHTRNFLLQRMRRLAGALEGLRERLEQPVHRLDALLWRLRGPYGPIALAKQVAAEAGEGAAFMIAEVAETIGSAKIPAAGELTSKTVASAQQAVVSELESMARSHPSPADLSAYVESVFRELGT